MIDLFAILITGAIGIGVPATLMWLLKIKPSHVSSHDGFIEGYIVGSMNNNEGQ
jgi:hypothetical protein